MDFKITFVEFNARRMLRGAEAARFRLEEDGESALLWMSKRDIRANITQFGADPELQKGLDAYKAGVTIEEASTPATPPPAPPATTAAPPGT